ncbi:MAG: prohibitin family protein [Magnetococcus sp. YQC-5]
MFIWPHIFITIHAGEAGVLYRRFAGGTVLDRVYAEGFWMIFPWNVMTIYDIRVQAIKHDFTVLSADGLPIHLMLLIRFQPEYDTLAVLHQRVGPDYVAKIVVPTVESVIRKSIGRFRQDEIYQTKKGILASIVLLAIQEAGRKYVHMDDVIIRTIELPASIQQAIENKLVYEQELASYEFRLRKEAQEKSRKEIEAQGIQTYQKIIAQSLDENILHWHGIEATKALANSANAKVVVIGSGKSGLPLIGSIPMEESVSGKITPNTPPVIIPQSVSQEPPPTKEGVGNEAQSMSPTHEKPDAQSMNTTHENPDPAQKHVPEMNQPQSVMPPDRPAGEPVNNTLEKPKPNPKPKPLIIRP